MTKHQVKCWPAFYQEILARQKTAEIRRNDRDYRAGDVLELREWDPDVQQYSGRSYRVAVAAVRDLTPIGIPGFVQLELRVPPYTSFTEAAASDEDPRCLPEVLLSPDEHEIALTAKRRAEEAGGQPLTWAEFVMLAVNRDWRR